MLSSVWRECEGWVEIPFAKYHFPAYVFLNPRPIPSGLIVIPRPNSVKKWANPSSRITRSGSSSKLMVKVYESYYRYTLQYGLSVCQIFLVPKNKKKAKLCYKALVKPEHKLNGIYSEE